MSYPFALVLTLVVELPIYLATFRLARLLPGWRAWAAAIGVNLLTHPIVWAVLTARPGWLLPVEVAVGLVEGLLLYAWVRRDLVLLLVVGTVANTASVLAGWALSSSDGG